jgi:pyrroline-5-carboxylate reductase
MSLPPILLVGCGRMGSAMLSGWREQGLAASVAVDPAPDAVRMAGPDLTVVPDAASIPADFVPAAVVLAVKPQSAAEALPQHARYAGQAVFLSIMAGRTIGGMRSLLSDSAAIVRAMPNTPAAVRQGVTVACPGDGVTTPQRALCERLLQAIGVVAWVNDEALLDPVTAVSGSGPAYVFLLDLARLLARQTVSGSGALLAASPEDAAALRIAVTSPGGTTERALAVLMASDAWPKALSRAIADATKRSRELAG